jgi:type II secretory pathway component PulF
MPRYIYHATDREQHPQRGELHAPDLETARGELQGRGWSVLSIVLAASPSPPRLTAEEAEELMQQVARLARGGFPLGPALRAAADESESPRVASALRQLADRSDQGQNLPALLQDAPDWLPAHIAGLILAALRSGRLGEALLELVEHQRAMREMQRNMWQALSYPLTVALIATCLLGVIGFWMTGIFTHLYDEFSLILPRGTRQLLWWREVGIWLLGGLSAFLFLVVVGFRLQYGPVVTARALAAFPFFGPLVHLHAVAEWSSLMSVLVRNQVPLPDALRWSATGVRNDWLAHCSLAWAEESAQGNRLSDSLVGRPAFPQGLLPIVRWGEQQNGLAEALSTTRQVVERRVHFRTELMRTVLPAALFLFIGCAVAMLVVGIFMPLATLVEGLN